MENKRKEQKIRELLQLFCEEENPEEVVANFLKSPNKITLYGFGLTWDNVKPFNFNISGGRANIPLSKIELVIDSRLNIYEIYFVPLTKKGKQSSKRFALGYFSNKLLRAFVNKERAIVSYMKKIEEYNKVLDEKIKELKKKQEKYNQNFQENIAYIYSLD